MPGPPKEIVATIVAVVEQGTGVAPAAAAVRASVSPCDGRGSGLCVAVVMGATVRVVVVVGLAVMVATEVPPLALVVVAAVRRFQWLP